MVTVPGAFLQKFKKLNNKGFTTISGVLLANIFNQSISFFIILLATKLLTVDDFASFAIAISITMLWGVFIDFGISMTVVRKYNTMEREDEKSDFINISYFWKLILCIFNFIISIPLTKISILFFPLLQGYEFLVYSSFISGGLISLWMTIRSIEQAQRNFSSFKKYTFIYGFLRLAILIFILVLDKFEVNYVFLALYGAPLILLIIYDLISKKLGRASIFGLKWSAFLKSSFAYSKWIALSAICFILLLRLPQFFLGSFSSVNEVALYSSAITFVVIFSLLNDAIRTVIMPDIAKINTNEDRTKYKVKILKFFPVVLICGLLIMVLISLTILVFLDEIYIQSIPIFWIIGIANVLVIYIGLFNILIHSYGVPKLDAINNIGRLLLLILILLIVPQNAIYVSLSYATVIVLGEVFLMLKINKLSKTDDLEK